MKKFIVFFVLLFLSLVLIACSSEENSNCTGIIKNAYIEDAEFFGLVDDYDNRRCDVTLRIEYTEDCTVGKTGTIDILNKNGEKMYSTIFEVNENLKGGFIYREKSEFLRDVDPNNPKAQTAKIVLRVNGNVVGTATFDDVDARFYGE